MIKILQNSESWWKDLECSKYTDTEEKPEHFDGSPLYNEITAEIAAEAKKAQQALDKSTYKKVEEFVTSHAVFFKKN